MRNEWGRAPEAGRWQRAVPVWFMSVVLMALASGTGMWWTRQTIVWTPLQQFYLSAYARSALASSLAIRSGRYRLLLMENRRGTRLAIDDEVVPISTTTGEATFELSELARQARAGRLVWRDLVLDHGRLHTDLEVWIYHNQTLTDLARPSLITALVVLIAGLLIAIPKDVQWSRSRRHGRRLKGPELVTARRFNRRTRANGLRFVQVPHLSARLLGIQPVLKIPRAIESSHLLVMGDSGTGKSALIRQLLQQLEDRGDTAIVYDPALEYTPQFYMPERGDVILNPIDARSPYWSPGDELRHEAEALTLATSLFPDRANENPFFTEGPRRIFAHLLTFRPTAEELASWLCHDEELDRRVHGTPYASIIDRQAPAQRSGVLAALNMVADTLKLLPHESERAFAAGDRVQMTAPDRGRGVPNRDLGTVEGIAANGRMEIRWDSGRTSSFEAGERRHLDYGYAVTSHSSQGQTAGRVLVHVETDRASEKLVNQRLAYVAVSRGQDDARIYTDDTVKLARAPDRDVPHRSALESTREHASRQRPQHDVPRSESLARTLAVVRS
jgi:hypothetical protein